MTRPEPDRSAIVTGGTGGVGSALVQRLRAAGYGVVSVDVGVAPDDWAGDDGIVALDADVATEAAAAGAIQRAEAAFGRLDLVVNNAGLFLSRPIAETRLDDLQRLLQVNVVGAFLMTRAAVEPLARTRGAIVNLASISGMVGIAGQSAYSITKGAIVQFTRQAAIELAERGIRVSAVAPGAIETEFMATAARERGSAEPRTWDDLRAANPLGRVSSADEVADAILFLAGSPAITGAVVAVDGGHTAR